MSRKRKRNPSDVDVDLVQVYNQLADENESKRLEAARKLVSKIYCPDSTSEEQTNVILSRLFRGLCSSRKAARHGFAVALTELLSQIPIRGKRASTSNISTSDIVDILESSTISEGNNSGQDERDHFFGRLFGAEAMIKSGILFSYHDSAQWKRLLAIICSISTKKPWLRQECGWILFNCIDSSLADESVQDYALDIIDALNSHKLIRTPEGVAIWHLTSKKFPHAKLPKHVWKYESPLAAKDVKSLSDILKDARGKVGSDGAGFEAQGAAVWSANLHFAWYVVLSELFDVKLESEIQAMSGAGAGSRKEQVSFPQFWSTVVDDGLFSSESSPERKHWGLLIWARVLEGAPERLVQHTFTKNAVHCLVTSVRGEASYLRKSAQKLLQLIPTRSSASEDELFASECLMGLIRAVNHTDFDQLTNTKTIETLIEKSGIRSRPPLFQALTELYNIVGSTDEKRAALHHQYILNLQGKLVAIALRQHADGRSPGSEMDIYLTLDVLKSWISFAYFELESEDARRPFKERLAVSFEQGLRAGAPGRRLIREAIEHIRELQHSTSTTLKFDRQVAKQIEKAFKRLDALPRHNSTPNHEDSKSQFMGMELLYCVVVFEIYNGEAEAVEILEDLLAHDNRLLQSKKAHGISSHKDENGTADALVECLLSFAAKPSKFMRRVTSQIFDSLAPDITLVGLKSLTRVLATKENAQGQQEMFDAEVVDEIEDNVEEGLDKSSSEDSNVDTSSADSSSADVEDDIDAEMLASDVEVMSAPDTTSEDSSKGSSDTWSEKNEELAAFDAALASALGTRKGQVDLEAEDSSECSDEDMDDDEMMALDEKLTEVFRARKQETSKKKDRKDAKETIVNFKNRVLDLIDGYLKRECLNPLSIELILPLLEMIRLSRTKQLADKCCGILREYCSRCKGHNVPDFDRGSVQAREEIANVLKDVHREACLESSNAHSTAASQASLLLVKTLIRAGADIRVPIDIYGDTRMMQLTNTKCRVPASFFTDWNNWCAQAKTQLSKFRDPEADR